MAKLTEYKNPLTNKEGSIFSVSDWIGGIMWVVMFGIMFAIGANIVGKIDKILPGNQTPNMKPYEKEVVVDTGIQTL